MTSSPTPLSWTLHQTVTSAHEPELGTGTVTAIQPTEGFLEVHFSGVQETRRYTLKSPPLLQASIRSTGVHSVPPAFDIEGQLERIWGGFQQLDPFEEAFLRRDALQLKTKSLSHPAAGLAGAKVIPLPHQFYLGHTVARRLSPRVILADEVGLGKTVEAGLTFAALKAVDLAERVLIMVPDALVHQWVHEFKTKFQELFAIVDAGRMAQDLDSQHVSSFQLHQKIIVPYSLFQDYPKWLVDAVTQPWDLIIIDEAHHMDWDEVDPDPKWLIAKTLSEHTRGLLLLTATPRQFGLTNQFGLLALIDPHRFHDFQKFLEECEWTNTLGACALELSRHTLSASHASFLKKHFANDTLLHAHITQQDWAKLLSALIDRHPTGRYIFRNRRSHLTHNVQRALHLIPLSPTTAYRTLQQADLHGESLSQKTILEWATGRRAFLEQDMIAPKLSWLAKQLAQHPPGKKTLIVVSTTKQIPLVREFLAQTLPDLNIGEFHQDLDALARDHQGALFASSKNHMSVLLCTDLGSEGRNFQQASTLILLDLPTHPDLLIQRIGRLDRIGQKQAVDIYVPYFENTPEEALAEWYHLGLTAFTKHSQGLNLVLEEVSDGLIKVCEGFLRGPTPQNRHDLEALIRQTHKEQNLQKAAFETTIDVMLDYNSFVQDKAAELMDSVDELDDNPQVEIFTRSLLDHYGVDYDDDIHPHTLVVRPDSLMFLESLPGFALDDTLVIGFDRSSSLQHEHIQFVSLDHPLIDGFLNFFTTSKKGALSILQAQNHGYKPGIYGYIHGRVYIEAPKHLEMNRYIPKNLALKEWALNKDAQPVSIEVDRLAQGLLKNLTKDALASVQPQLLSFWQSLTPHFVRELNQWLLQVKTQARAHLIQEQDRELAHMAYLVSMNTSMHAKDLDQLSAHYATKLDTLNQAHILIDAAAVWFLQ